jgi:hypothetical protein
MALQPSLGPWPLFSFLVLYTVGRTPWMGDQPVPRPLPIHRTTQTQNKRTQISMPGVGFEPMTPVFERAKTVHAFDRAATVIGTRKIIVWDYLYVIIFLNVNVRKVMDVSQRSVIVASRHKETPLRSKQTPTWSYWVGTEGRMYFLLIMEIR